MIGRRRARKRAADRSRQSKSPCCQFNFGFRIFCPIRAPGKAPRYQRASITARKSFASFVARPPEYETQMILRVGLWPRTNAGNATDAVIDFSDRGGMLMISRLISPQRTRWS